MRISGASALFALLLLALSIPAAAQTRDFRAERIVIDDNNGNPIVLQTPAGPIIGGTLIVPDPAGSGTLLISNPSGGSQSISGDILPGTDDTYDLGSGASRWQDIFASGDVSIGGQARFVETGGGTDYVGFQAPAAVAANQIWTLPAADGTNGQVLATDGAGNLAWQAPNAPGVVGSTAIVYKGSDETVNAVNPRALQSDDDLSYALTANTTYHVDGIIFATETNGNPNLRIGFDVPTGTTIRVSYFGFNEAGSNQERGILTADATESNQLALNTTITAFRISGVVDVGATAGDIDFQWIPNSTTTTHQVTVQQRSFLRFTQIDVPAPPLN